MSCQLKTLWAAGMTRWDRLGIQLRRRTGRLRRFVPTVSRVRRVARRLWDAPILAMRKTGRALGMERRKVASVPNGPTMPPLGLQPGDRVRVKLAAEIQATLDSGSRYERLHYSPATMDRYCGDTYTVVKRVDQFYDEYSGRMLRLKNTVILDGVYCEPEPGVDHTYAGCKRTCFLFWKEGWLERVGPDQHAKGQATPNGGEETYPTTG